VVTSVSEELIANIIRVEVSETEDEGDTYLRSVGNYLQDYTVITTQKNTIDKYHVLLIYSSGV
jgi:hypothetical protein